MYTSLVPAAANSTSEAILLYMMFCRPDSAPSASGSPGCDVGQHTAFSMAITISGWADDDDKGGWLGSIVNTWRTGVSHIIRTLVAQDP